MLPPLLDALDCRANTAIQRPIIKALAFIKANRDSRQQHFAVDGTVPIEGVVPPLGENSCWSKTQVARSA